MNEEELKQMQSKAIAQFRTGKSLFGKDGAFAPMLKQCLESALEAEMEEHRTGLRWRELIARDHTA